MEKFNEELTTAISDFAKESTKETVKTIETKKKEREKETIEDGVRDHLRGFSRTIPSFLMAYGDNTVTLATFDTIIPDKVFLEVTSITLDQFKFLRDGGDYVEEETGQTKHFDGQLFDSVVFDDSVKEFLALKKKLADYFDEKSVEDIFDYIPPQKTNQIFTPKTMVKKMVDMLEQENPGCFDMPDKTFIDLYMKSGLYITEIVKRLYQSDEMKKQFPDNKERLKHIFEKQVYGLAPTEIIYKIATSYILGFDEDTKNIKRDYKIMITDAAINKVPRVQYKEIPETEYDNLRELARQVLQISKDENDSNEVAVTYSLESAQLIEKGERYLGIALGAEHDVDPLSDSTSLAAPEQKSRNSFCCRTVQLSKSCCSFGLE